MSKSTIRNGVMALLLISSAVGVFGIMVYQVIAQGDHLNSQIEVLEKERARDASYYQLVRIEEESTADREELRSHYLFKESDSIDFLNRVETLAPEVGVSLKTDKLNVITDESDNSEWVQVSFSFSGSRERVQRFIQVLESLPYVLRVTEVEMGAKSSTEWSVNLTLQVRVLAYDK
ncbi:MAG: hypothetical protein ACI9BF_000326 [Candidatus Paceibacteria bacterium]|jgi:hypothetical protein